MKKIYLSIVAAVSLMFVSCTADWLNTDPSTAVPSDDAIKNIDDAQVALNGIYRLASAHSYYVVRLISAMIRNMEKISVLFIWKEKPSLM